MTKKGYWKNLAYLVTKVVLTTFSLNGIAMKKNARIRQKVRKQMKRSEYEKKMADLQSQIEELKKVKIEEEDKRWKPTIGDSYYIIRSDGLLVPYKWNDSDYDNGCYAIGNCFKTWEEAKFARESLKVLAELRNFSEEDDAEWDGEIRHYHIYYDFDGDAVRVDWNKVYACAELYFATEECAERAIEAVGKDRIKKYYLRIKESED